MGNYESSILNYMNSSITKCTRYLNVMEYFEDKNKKVKLILSNGRECEQLNLWNNEIFLKNSDIIIILDNKEYKLNKEILRSSSVLKALICGGFKESLEEKICLDENELTRLGWEYSLNYLYYTYAQKEKDLIEAKDLDINNVIEIFISSNYLQICPLLEDTIFILSNLIKEKIWPLYGHIDSKIRFDHRNIDEKDISDIINFINRIPGFYLVLNTLDDIHIAIILTLYTKFSDQSGSELLNDILSRFDINIELHSISDLENYLQDKKTYIKNNIGKKYFIENKFLDDLLFTYLSLVFCKNLVDALSVFKQIINSVNFKHFQLFSRNEYTESEYSVLQNIYILNNRVVLILLTRIMDNVNDIH